MNVKATPVEDIIRRLTLEHLSQPNLRAQLEATNNDSAERVTLLERIEASEQAMTECGSDYYQHRRIPRHVYDEMIVRLSAEVEQAQRELERVTSRTRLGALPTELAELERTWDTSAAKAKALASQVMDSVLIQPPKTRGRHFFDPDRVDPVWRQP